METKTKLILINPITFSDTILPESKLYIARVGWQKIETVIPGSREPIDGLKTVNLS